MQTYVHNIRFYKPKSNCIYFMSLSAHKKLALCRSDSSIEIWDISDCPIIEKTIVSTVGNLSVEGLSWYDNRLFSVGLHGFLVEYDLYKLCIKNKVVVTGEAAFCLDINGNQVAIGTEQGYLNIFTINEEDLLFHKFLDKQEGRILCLKYNQTGEFIVSGSIDAIRVWSVATGHALHRMTTGRSEINKPTVVWCLEVLDDLTIISGDSRGKMTLWDGKIGAQIESHQSHLADILSLCLSEDKSSLYCAGIDPHIINYVRITVKDGTQKWVKSIQRKIHDHDVRALVMNGHKLYSGGVDGYLTCSYHPPKTLLKFPPILQNPCVVIATKAKLALLRYPKFVEIWTLGQSKNERDIRTGLFTLESEPRKLVLLQKVIKISREEEDTEGIICASISDDGEYVVYSTQGGVRVFHLTCSADGTPKLTPLEILDELGCCPCVNAVFSHDNHLILAPNTGGLQVFSIDDNNVILTQSINTSELNDTITFLTISSCGKYLVAGDPHSNICVWTRRKNQFQFHYKLPKYHSPPTALAIHPTLFNLVVAYTDSNIVEYDIKGKRLTEFSRFLSKNLPKHWTSRSYAIRNVTFDPRTDKIILHDDSNIIVVEKSEEIVEKTAKAPKLQKEERSQQVSGFRSIKKYKHLVHLSWISDNEMVVVEVNPIILVEDLPPVFKIPMFGKK